MIDELTALEQVAARLEAAGVYVVFAGGVVLPFYVRDHRGTEDLDCFAEATEPELGASLRRAGFHHAPNSGVIVRWRSGEESVDVIPRNGYFGFDTRWNDIVFAHARTVVLPSGRSVRVVSPATLLVLKMAAFDDRGAADPIASRDAADIAALAVECPDLLDDLRELPVAAKSHAGHWAARVLGVRTLREALEFNAPRGTTSDPGGRALGVLRAIAGMIPSGSSAP